MPRLRIESLSAPVDSLTIGGVYRDIIQAKLDEFNQLLDQRKLELDVEYRTFAVENDLGRGSRCGLPVGPPGIGEEMRNHQQKEINSLREVCQTRLDQIFHKFQTQWLQDPRDKSISFPLPKTGTESKYLGEQLGEALGRGLAEVCEQRPTDPIEYLGMWLKKYSQNMKREQEAAILSLKVRLEEEEVELLEEHKESMSRERIHIRQEEERRRKIFLEQAKQIEKAKDSPPPPKSPETGAGTENDEPEMEKEGQTSATTKRVTVVEPENPNTLYTIEEKDSISGTADGEEEEEHDEQTE